MRRSKLVLVDADTVGRARTGDEAYTVNLLRELPFSAPDLTFAASLRDPGRDARRRAAVGSPARAARRVALSADSVRAAGARAQRASRAPARPVLRRSAPVVAVRRDRARSQLHQTPRALHAARSHAARPARSRVGAPRIARDRSVGLHAAGSARSLRARARPRGHDPQRRCRALPSRSEGSSRDARDARPRAPVRAVRRRAPAAQERGHAGRGVRPATRAPGRRAGARRRRSGRSRRRCATACGHSGSATACDSSATCPRTRFPGSTAPRSCSRSRPCTRDSGYPRSRRWRVALPSAPARRRRSARWSATPG